MEATKTLGEEFHKLAQKALRDGAVDVDIKEGKRTGAYSTGIYGVGPFILLNHNNNIDSAFTIAHEGGHSMHTLLADETQPYSTHDYTIFVAEIASTFNEQLLLDYLIKTSNDNNFKIALIAQAIDGLLGTFYRQSLFADYEYQAHKLAENGQTITDEALSNIMKDLYMKYYNIDLSKEQYKEMVWAYIPHFFFTPYYVYQYATSFSASLQLYQNVRDKKEGAFDRYIGLLKSGGSDYPVNQVLAAGVDLTTEKPFLAVVDRLKELVGLLEQLLATK
jgi:oligoendopeptidase F